MENKRGSSNAAERDLVASNDHKSRNNRNYRKHDSYDVSKIAKKFLDTISTEQKPEGHEKKYECGYSIRYVEDPKCYGFLRRSIAFDKGEMISKMVDGVMESGDYDTFQVYSHSSNYRIVDMLVCKCNCPNNKEICSHLIGVSLKYRFKRNYMAKLVMLAIIERHLNYLLENDKDISSNNVINKVVVRVCNYFTKIQSVPLELLIGIIFRMYQRKRGIELTVGYKCISCNTKVEFAPDEESAEETDTIPEPTDRREHDVAGEISSRHSIEVPGNHLREDAVKEELCVEHTSPIYTDSLVLDLTERCILFLDELVGFMNDDEEVIEVVRMMLSGIYKINVDGEPVKQKIFKLMTENRGKESLLDVYYISNIYSLGCYSVIGDGTYLGDVSVDSLIKMITEAPMIVNLYESIMWFNYERKFGRLYEFIQNEKLSFISQFSFIYINDEHIIKIKSPNCFNNDLMLFSSIIDSINDLNVISFLSNIFSFIVKKKSTLPKIPLITTTINEVFRVPNDNTNTFLLVLFSLVPNKLILPLAKVLLSDTIIFNDSYIAQLVSFIHGYNFHINLDYRIKVHVKVNNAINNLRLLKYDIPWMAEGMVIDEERREDKQIFADIISIEDTVTTKVVEEDASISPYHVIQDIRMNEFGIGREMDDGIRKIINRQYDRIVRAVKRLSEDMYNNNVHLQLELIQNADDNAYSNSLPFISFFYDSTGVVMMNNENGFREADVRTICDVGSSAKFLDKIGKFGIGFKSVFVLTENPHIFSNGYNFMFSSNDELKDNIKYLLPHYIDVNTPMEYIRDKLSESSRDLYTNFYTKLMGSSNKKLTLMYFPLKPEFYNNDAFIEYYRQFQGLDVETLVFLRKMKLIKFCNVIESLEITLHKQVVENYDIREMANLSIDNVKLLMLQSVKNKINDEMVDVTSRRLLLISHEFQLSQDEINMLRYGGKLHKPSYTISIGIPFYKLTNCKVYNFLPIGDYGLKFLVNSDFILSANRQNIMITEPINELIANKISDVFTSLVYLIQNGLNEDLYQSFINVLPYENEGRSIFKSTCKRIFSRLLELDWILTEDGSYHIPSKCVYDPDNIISIVFTSAVLKKYCDLYYVNKRFYRDGLSHFGVKRVDYNLVSNLVCRMAKYINLNVSQNDQEELVKHYLDNIGVVFYLLSRFNEELTPLKDYLIVYDGHFNLFNIDDVYYHIGGQLSSSLKIINASIMEDRYNLKDYTEMLVKVFKSFGITEITSENYLNSVLISKIPDPYQSLSVIRTLIESEIYNNFNDEVIEMVRGILIEFDDGLKRLDKILFCPLINDHYRNIYEFYKIIKELGLGCGPYFIPARYYEGLDEILIESFIRFFNLSTFVVVESVQENYISNDFNAIVEFMSSISATDAYGLSRILYQILSVEVNSTFMERSDGSGPSSFHEQIYNLSWCPFGECNPGGEWYFTNLSSLSENYNYPFLFKQIDPSVKNDVLTCNNRPDLFSLLDIICKSVRLLREGNDSFEFPSFSATVFRKLIDDKGIMSVIGMIYTDIEREDSVHSLYDKIMVEDTAYPFVKVLCAHEVTIHHCIDSVDSLAIYTMLGFDLYNLWRRIGVTDYLTVEKCINLLDDAIEPCNLKKIFELLMHLHRNLSRDEFKSIIWNRKVIPITNDINRCFIPDELSGISEGSKAENGHTQIEFEDISNISFTSPEDGIVSLFSKESMDVMNHFNDSSIWLACSPSINNCLWEEILTLLEARDFINVCEIKLIPGYDRRDSDGNDLDYSIKLHVLAPLLPYLHLYIKHNDKPYYQNLQWDWIKEIFDKLLILPIDPLEVIYQFNDIESSVIRYRSLIYRKYTILLEGNGFKPRISREHEIKSALNSISLHVADLIDVPIEFFNDFIKVLNIKHSFTPKFLHSIYKMLPKFSIQEISRFSEIFCNDAPLECKCFKTLGYNSYGAHLNSCLGTLDPFTFLLVENLSRRKEIKEVEIKDVDYNIHLEDYIYEDSKSENKPILEDEIQDVANSVIKSINIANFELHQERLTVLDGGECGTSGVNREHRRRVGYLGEELVYEMLVQLHNEEIRQGECKVVWHNKLSESGFCYDLTVLKSDGETFVEVKSSSSAVKTFFEISYKEWLFAQIKGKDYEIYRVFGIGSKDIKVTKIVNPYHMWKNGNLGFCLTL